MNLEKIDEERTRDFNQASDGVESDYSEYTSSIDNTEEEIGSKRIKLDGNEATYRESESLSDQSSQGTKRSLSLDGSSLTTSRENNTDIDIAKMCCTEQPIESTRISTEVSNNRSIDQTYLDTSSFKTIILADDTTSKEVSIISKLVNLIFTVHSDLKKISINGINISSNSLDGADQTIMRAVCCMKTIRDLTSTLCSVHEAVGLSDLKLLSYAFKDEVNDAWTYMKTIVMQCNISDSCTVNFKHKIHRLLELAGGLSLAAVDHIKKDEDTLYINEDFKGELSIYFLKHQNRFLTTMLDEAISTIANGIEEMKQFQLSSSHEMSEDLVDGVMNILTSIGTLFQQCQDLTLVYVKSTEQCSGLYFAEECYHLRNMLTDIIDYNENIKIIIEKSKLVAKNCDALDEFLDVPIVLADITKCICNTVGKLLSYITTKKSLDEVMIDALYESLERFIFAGKTVRVGVSMLVQEVEKDLNVDEDSSIISFVQADTSFGKRESLCPMNTSEIDVSSLGTKLKSKFKKDRRSSHSEQYVSRYMDLSSISEK